MLAFSFRHAAGFLGLGRLRGRGVSCVPERWQAELARMRAQMKISRPVTLVESWVADVPMVLGHFRPLILFPVGMLAGYPAPQVQAILLHELAHVRRHDYLVNVLQRLVETLLFYHPGVWWISQVLCVEREKCCDDAVVSLSGRAYDYALALATLEENRSGGPEPAVAATGGILMQRIHRLLYPEGPNTAWTPMLAAVILIATAGISAAAWRSQSSVPAAGQKQESATSYSRWLNEDVVYIIEDGERAAFQKLTTDKDRDRFIEQFWERRNPAPDLAENAFKEEHYRGIEYANKHFTTVSGWQTDRGHIYIAYGPPDEIDWHPKDGSRAIGTDEWRFLHSVIGKDGYVTFIDQTGAGDYRLAPGE